MAASVNTVFLLGNLGRDPELKYTQGGSPVTSLSLATNEYSKDGGDRVEWHRVVVFGQSAENCCRYLHKGSTVHIEGSLRTRQWETQTGEKRYVTEVIARRVQFLDKSEASSRDTNEYQNAGYADQGHGRLTQQLAEQNTQYSQQPAQQSQQAHYDSIPF